MTTPTETNGKELAAVCRKLSAARVKLHASNPTKSGENKFAGYSYFELGDFMPQTLAAFEELGLCGIVSFTTAEATLQIVDTESGASLSISSPMSEATLKGCHPVQNLGAVQTYQRRYLWSAAMELTESDALDSAEPKETTTHTATHTPPKATQPELKAIEGESFTARVAGIEESSGETNGKKWIKHVVNFDNQRKATTFKEEVLGKAAVGDRVEATIRPGKKAGYYDLVSLTVLGAGEERENPSAGSTAPKKGVWNPKRDEVNSIWESRIIDYEEEPNRAGKMEWTFKFEDERKAWTSNPELAERACELMGDVPLTITVRPGRTPGDYVLMGVDA